ncbi:MAG: hypothetical protein V7L11_29095 [Nostoc sp.]
MPRTQRFYLVAAFLIPVWLGATLGYWGLRGQTDYNRHFYGGDR